MQPHPAASKAPARALGVFVALVTLALLGTSIAESCPACYRSLDWQVGHARWIVAGRVEVLDELPRLAGKDLPPPEAGPAIATVRVMEVLRGPEITSPIDVRTGPVHTCSMFEDSYVALAHGEAYVFFFHERDPRTGLFEVVNASDVVPLTQLDDVRRHLHAADAFRRAFLEDLEARHPEDAVAARALVEELRGTAPTWPAAEPPPAPAPRERRPEWTRPPASSPTKERRVAARVQLLARLEHVPLRVVVGALAQAWLREDLAGWQHEDVLDSALRHLEKERRGDVRRLQHEEWTRLLTATGEPPERIDSFLTWATERVKGSGGVSFPVAMPRLSGAEGSVLATGLRLVAASDNPGLLVRQSPNYTSRLQTLDPRDLDLLVPGLLGRADALRHVGVSILRAQPQPVLVPDVVQAVLEGGDASVVRGLVEPRYGEDAVAGPAVRWLDALWDHVVRTRGDTGLIALLRRLGIARTYPRRALMRALAIAAGPEPVKPAEGGGGFGTIPQPPPDPRPAAIAYLVAAAEVRGHAGAGAGRAQPSLTRLAAQLELPLPTDDEGR
ncbi:MAG: hypothetical protein H6806_12730 [Planctomycetes bacterium]|nr:hypothetical protein [Planctomycetota bacterium]MCB9830609.1 hypothetical protein [Planctomycetota bacterium]MCB9901168.1 hypothetical protein [Planctomycetota bacterium]